MIQDKRPRNKTQQKSGGNGDASELPPHNLDAEKAILGAFLLDITASRTALQAVTADHFYLSAHQDIYRAIVALDGAGNGVDVVQVADWLEQRDLLKKAGGEGYLATLCESVPTVSHALGYALPLREALSRRLTRMACLQTIQAIRTKEGDTGGILAELTAATEKAQEQAGPIASPLATATVLTELLTERIEPPQWAIRGLCLKDQFNIIAGPPGVGKSYLALAVGLCAAAGKNVTPKHEYCADRPLRTLYIALEGGRQFRRRTQQVACGYGITGGDFALLQRNPELWTDDGKRRFATMVQREGYDLVILDTFRKAFRLREDGQEGMPAAESFLSELAQITTVLLVHHTRKRDKDDWIPSIDDLSGGGQIGAGCDFALIIKRNRDGVRIAYNPKSNPTQELPAFAFTVVSENDATRLDYLEYEEPVRRFTRQQTDEEKREAILCYLKTVDMASVRRIQRAVGGSKTTIKGVIETLLEDEEIDAAERYGTEQFFINGTKGRF